MQPRLKELLLSMVKFEPDELESFDSILKTVEIPKNEPFITKGERVARLGYIVDGLLEMYDIDSRGNEISIDFFFPHRFITDYISFLSGSPSNVNIRSIKKATIQVLEKSSLDKLYESSFNFQKFGRLAAEHSFIEFAERIRNSFASPEERYQSIVNDRPHWIQNLPQYKIASYLNVSAEWLSKLRTKR